MQNIVYAIKGDSAELKKVMEEVVAGLPQKDWYVADDIDFLERHIEDEGYILKCVVEEQIVGFLVVRYPKLAEDNLGQYLPNRTEELLLNIAHMESVAVLPRFRGYKIQKQLLEMAEEIEKNKNTTYLMATPSPRKSADWQTYTPKKA